MVIAMMAVQVARLLVNGHACVAMVAIGQPATVVTLQCGGVTAPVNKDQHLVARLESREMARAVRRGIQYDPAPPV